MISGGLCNLMILKQSKRLFQASVKSNFLQCIVCVCVCVPVGAWQLICTGVFVCVFVLFSCAQVSLIRT